MAGDVRGGDLCSGSTVCLHRREEAARVFGLSRDTIAKMTGAKDVKQLQEQINEVANNIGRDNPEFFSKKVSEWWGKVVDWLGKAG